MLGTSRSDETVGNNPGVFSTQLTRRTLLTGAGSLLASTAWSAEAFAETPASGASTFCDVSKAATGKSNLSVITAERILRALSADDSKFEVEIEQLSKLAGNATSPQDLSSAAEAVGLKPTLMAIITAWYTGTVQTKAGPVVVAYNEALMYRPVADGLTVPTYCNKGPLWWTGLPPEITVMPTNNPKVL